MVDIDTTNPTVKASELALLSQLDELRSAWQEDQSARAKGGSFALSGFEHQFLLTLLKIVRRWKEASEAERQDPNTAHRVLTEAISDITESGRVVTLTQVKRTLSGKAIREALEELWEIFNLASERTPGLVEHLRFKISGKFEDNRNPNKVINEWNPILKRDQAQRLDTFKARVSYEFVADPKTDLTAELENLSRDEATETTIGRWLGYLLQLGSGVPPERISALIWRELRHDKSLEAFRATLARLFSKSRYRLRAVRHTLGSGLSLPRTDTLLQLQASVLAKRITLLIGSSGSGKSALCKLGMQTSFQEHTCLFLHASDVVSFTEAPNSTSTRDTRRLDELLAAQVIEKPIIIIDDLSDVNDQSFDSLLNLLQNALTSETSTDVRFVLVAHLDAERSVYDKIAARFGADLPIDVVRLPQLPTSELQSSNALPGEVASLVQRAAEFGPALNLKLLDWLVSSVQRDGIKASSFRSDIDLLAWFWHYHVGNGREVSEEGRLLIGTALLLAEKFTPDLSLYDSPVDTRTLYTLVRRDCLRVAEGRVAVTHRFVGDCARFRYLLGNRRNLEISELATKLRNPLWSQPMRWFALYLAMESEETETWQELLQESFEGNHLQLIDLLLDGAILSRKGSYVLQGCSGEHLRFFIERLISRLLAIATAPTPDNFGVFQSMSASAKLMSHERRIGTPRTHLWEPVWRWLVAQNQEALIEKSDLIFKPAEAWLNWGVAERFPLQVQVAELILDLAQRVLLPDPDQQKRYWLRDSSSAAFTCIVFTLKLVPSRSAWLLRALAGREIIPANRLEPTETSASLTTPGIGVLTTPHPRGPLGKVNERFRRFMLSRGGLYLDSVVRANPQLGAELLLALTISPPIYRYRIDNNSRLDTDIDELGTEGSGDVTVCTFKFLPLLSLFQINEVFAVDVVATLCDVATDYWHEHHWSKNRMKGSLKTDTDGLILLIGDKRKHFKGGRHALYWHRNHPFSPRIIACFLMTLEGWLYSLPTRAALERSISIIFERADTVALLGVFISLAKCDPRLLSSRLLPLVSSLQLFIWLEFEQIDRGQNYGFDVIGARRLLEEEREELRSFHVLPHRNIPLLNVALRTWLQGNIPFDATSRILADWDNHQLNLIPAVSRYRALKIRAWFERNHWLLEKDEQGNRMFRFIGTLPQDPEIDAEAESALWNLQHFQIVMTHRQILDGELPKTPELHKQLITLLTSEEQLTSLKDRLEEKAFIDTIWATIAVVLESPINELNQELENYITDYASNFSNLPISLDNFSRCQNYDMDAEAFIAHAAPKLLRRCKSESSLRASAFRCLIGVRNCSTSVFMRSWIREYGLAHPLTQEFINIAPRIARIISLTSGVSYTKIIQKSANPDGSYLVPRPEDISEEISKREDPQIEEAWSNLQCDFVERKSLEISLIDAFEWTPEILAKSLQQRPRWLQICFDWDFLAAVLIPVLEAQPEGETAQDSVSLLHEQVLFALLHERERIYADYRAAQEEDGYRLYQAQSQLLDTIVKSNPKEIVARIDELLNVIRTVRLLDCIVLGHVVDTLNYYIVEDSSSEVINNSFRKYTAFAVGEYLFGLRNQQELDLRIFGRVREVWEKLIDLLSRDFPENVEKAITTDQWLMEFFKRFQDALLPNRLLRIELYRVGKSTRYRQFRRILFTTLMQHQELLPTSRSEDSELLVQVLAELWDSDCTWVTNRQSRLNSLRILLGQLQEIDAVGARRLADQIADSLADRSE
jgi:hypothetical protein